MKYIFLAIFALTFFSTSILIAEAASPRVENLLAEEKQHSLGQVSLGEIYYYGSHGTTQNLSEAYYWFSICGYTLSATTDQGLKSMNSFIIEANQSEMVPENPMSMLTDPAIKTTCETYIQTLNKKLSSTVRLALQPRIDAWKKEHPLPVASTLSAEEERKKFLTRRLWTEISAYGFANKGYDFEGIKKLISQGADVNAIRSGKPIVEQIAASGRLEPMKIFIAAGSKVNEKTLDAAYNRKHMNIVEFLLKQGAHPSADLKNYLSTCPIQSKPCSDETSVYNTDANCSFSTCPTPSSNIQHVANVTIKRLQDGTSDEKTAAIKDIMLNPRAHDPTVLNQMANVLFQKFRDDEGLFWYVAANLRKHMDYNLCQRDTKKISKWFELPKSTIAETYERLDPDRMLDITDKVIEWDRLTPVNYNRQWGTIESTCFPEARQNRIKDSLRMSFKEGNRFTLKAEYLSKMNMDDLIPLAEAGDKEAQSKLGYCYSYKDRCLMPLDDRQKQYDATNARRYSAKTTSETIAAPDFKDEYKKKALFWLNKSVEQKYAPALRTLAQAYIDGNTIVEKDFQKSCLIALDLAKLDKSAAFNIMAAASWAMGKKKNEQYAWLMTAAKAKNPDKLFASDTLEYNMSNADLAAAQALGEQYIEKYINQSKPVCDPDTLKQ